MVHVRGTTFSGFLQFLTAFPDPNQVAQAIVKGPLAQFGCQSLTIWIESNFEELICVGFYGLENYAFERYSRLSLHVEAPITESFISSSPVILPVSTVLQAYPHLTVDSDFWEDVTTKNGNGDVGQMPIIANGVPIGAFAFLCDRLNEWDQRGLSVLNGLAASLGLWISNPQSAVLSDVPANNHEGLALTPRQVDILLLVREGRSNAAIAARLGFSQSTVKQEIQRVMKRLNSHRRIDAVHKAEALQLLTVGNYPPPRVAAGE